MPKPYKLLYMVYILSSFSSISLFSIIRIVVHTILWLDFFHHLKWFFTTYLLYTMHQLSPFSFFFEWQIKHVVSQIKILVCCSYSLCLGLTWKIFFSTMEEREFRKKQRNHKWEHRHRWRKDGFYSEQKRDSLLSLFE